MALPFLEKVFTREAVLRILIRKRCINAENYQKKIVVENLAIGVRDCSDKFWKRSELYDMFPPRRQWVHLGNTSKRSGYTSREKNERNLFLTVMKEHRKDGEHPEWYRLLSDRITNIIQGALTDKKLFRKPNVTVLEKKRDEINKVIECRPICLFKTLEQQIVASLYNKAFALLFDSYFYDNSLAFRPSKNENGGMSHLEAIKKIKAFRKMHSGFLWVAECDIKKFYDTIDHDVIKKRFNQLLLWSKQGGAINVEERKILKNAIYSYVDCFRFFNDVYKYNSKPLSPIWKKIRNSKGYKKEVKWVCDDIVKRDQKKWPYTYRTKKHMKYQIGVPQGGALSGIIANVVMHFVDIKLKKYWDKNPNYLYIRFCDDMTMMGENEKDITSAFNRYSEVVDRNHLYIHPPVPFVEKRMAEFWNGKTRPPYKWGEKGMDIFPWITFVGYDISWEGNARIRRASIRKEIKKQYEKKAEIERLLYGREGKQPQFSEQFIQNSLHNRMIGMSVGRVPIWDYKFFGNKCSWANAFTELTDNYCTRKQLQLLDKHRNLMIKQLSKRIEILDYSDIKPSDKKDRTEAVWYYGKPFSYFGQVLKKW